MFGLAWVCVLTVAWVEMSAGLDTNPDTTQESRARKHTVCRFSPVESSGFLSVCHGSH